MTGSERLFLDGEGGVREGERLRRRALRKTQDCEIGRVRAVSGCAGPSAFSRIASAPPQSDRALDPAQTRVHRMSLRLEAPGDEHHLRDGDAGQLRVSAACSSSHVRIAGAGSGFMASETTRSSDRREHE